MSNLVTRGLGETNLVTGGLGGSLGALTQKALAGALSLAGTVIATFVAAPDDDRTNASGRRFLGTFFGPRHKGHG